MRRGTRPVPRLVLAVALATGWAGSTRAAAPELPPAARSLVVQYQMHPIPIEGGWFRQLYRSSDILAGAALPARYAGRPHPAGTAIIGIETSAGFSALHSLRTDEVWHAQAGDPIVMLLLYPDGHGEQITLGPDRPMLVVPAGVWQGSHPAGPSGWSLFGTSMAPGFTPGDFTRGLRTTLQRAYPAFAARIAQLTRD